MNGIEGFEITPNWSYVFIKRDLSPLFYESDRKSYGNRVRRELGVDKELFHRVSLMRSGEKG